MAVRFGEDERELHPAGRDAGRTGDEPAPAQDQIGLPRPDQLSCPGDCGRSLHRGTGRLERVLSVDPRKIEEIDFIPGTRHQVGLKPSPGAQEGHVHTFISKLVGYGEGRNHVPRRTACRYHDVGHRSSFSLVFPGLLHRSGAVLHWDRVACR